MTPDMPSIADEALVSLRLWLADRGVMADELPEEEVIPRARVILLYERVTFYPGSFSKRFCRDLAGWPGDRRLSERQIKTIESIWITYRRQLRASGGGWPMGLARPPKDRPKAHEWTLADARKAEADMKASLESEARS